jgi:hypothetical protein
MKKITSPSRFAFLGLLGLLVAASAACSSSVDTADPGEGGGGAGGEASTSSSSSSVGSTTSSTATGSSSATTSSSGSTTTTSTTTGTTSSGMTGEACDLALQDCFSPGESCYPTADGALCAPTGTVEVWTQCEQSTDCIEGLFCNPENFMHCVPYCVVGSDECGEGESCFPGGQDVELPDGYGYCALI